MIVTKLRNLADLLEKEPVPDLEASRFYLHVYTKEDLLKHLRYFGGRRNKRLGFGGDDIYMESDRLPVAICVPRDKVCRKVVTYDCEPMFSPDDEKEIDAAALGRSNQMTIDLTPEDRQTIEQSRRWLRRLYLDGSRIELDMISREFCADLADQLTAIVAKLEEPQIRRTA